MGMNHDRMIDDEVKEIKKRAKERKKLCKRDPLQPELSLLVKLGSIAVHAQEMLSSSGHAFDRIALQGLLEDMEIEGWIESMGVYMPVKR